MKSMKIGEVAKLAGVPAKVLERAQGVFASLEASKNDSAKEVIDTLLSKDVSRLSPLEALNLLNTLQEKARGLTRRD